MKDAISCEIYANHLKKVNSALSCARETNRTLYTTIKDAHSEISKCKKDWKRFKLDVDCDESTFNKIVKICTNEFVMTHQDDLPSSWATLYAVTLLFKKDEGAIRTAIEEKSIHAKSTLKEINQLVAVKDVAKKSESTVVRIDSSMYIGEERSRLLEILHELETDFGIKVTDIAKRSEEPARETRTAMKEAA